MTITIRVVGKFRKIAERWISRRLEVYSACVWMERAPRRQSDWSLSAFVRNSSAAPGTLPGRQTQRDHPIQKSSRRVTLRPIIEGKQVIVGSSVSLLICFQGQMTSADSCFFLSQDVMHLFGQSCKVKVIVKIVFMTFISVILSVLVFFSEFQPVNFSKEFGRKEFERFNLK